MSKKLFTEAHLNGLTLSNHLVMAPMTRSRAIGNVPNDLMVEYYRQRTQAGLIITEGTSPSPNGTGYPRIPGIYTTEQVQGWKLVTDAVHEEGSKIFLQIMHTGRVGHPNNMPEGGELLSASAIVAAGEMYTDQAGPQPHPIPKEMTKTDIQNAISEFVKAAQNAVEAGFDGVELHGANGYLLEQFLSPGSNQRTDEYGGSDKNRNRFTLEVTEAVINAIGKDKTAIRLSPDGAFNDIQPYSEEQAELLAQGLNKLDVVYVHLVDHTSMGSPAVNPIIVQKIRAAFKGTLILSGGYDAARAEEVLQDGSAELVAFGRPFLSNPDLVERFKTGAPLNQTDFSTFYTPGEKGYTDYPVLAEMTA